MSNLAATIDRIASLRLAIASKGNIPEEVLRKIEYKFRLECNYNSNKIEGGTLTKPETRSVMVGNITVEGKPLKDIREMKGHDEVMKDILDIGKGEKRISEKRIKEIHQKIIVAETVEHEHEIGQWKQTGNHIYNYRGEKFTFTSPEDVASNIHDLLNWLNTGLDKIRDHKNDAPNPLLLAFEFHTRFLTIHPFVDGNGRTARLLTNLILVSLGYPPFWVTEGGEKDAYNRYLADIQAYGGSPDLLYESMAGWVARSLQLVLDAVEGKDIEDLDDWEKKLRLIKSALPSENIIRSKRTKETTLAIFERSIKPAVVAIIEKMQVYDELFIDRKMWLSHANSNMLIENMEALEHVINLNLNHQVNENITFRYTLDGYKKAAESPFFIQCKVLWKLEEYQYVCYVENARGEYQFLKHYDEFYAPEELNRIVSLCGEVLVEQLASRIQPG